MSARSKIAILKDDSNTIDVIYCHFDGYIEGVGLTLYMHYNDPEKAQELIDLGDISYLTPKLHPSPGVPHTFQGPEPGVTVAYQRDRGEETPKVTYKRDYVVESKLDFIRNVMNIEQDELIEYFYMMINGEWTLYKNDQFVRLEELNLESNGFI